LVIRVTGGPRVEGLRVYMRNLLVLTTSVLALSASPFSHTASAADFGGDCCADLEERVAELEATTVRKGNRKVSLFIYGEVNQAVMFWDDGAESNAYVVSNSTTKTKFGFEGLAQIDPEWSAGFRLEIDVRSAPSDELDQGATVASDNLLFGGVLSNLGTTNVIGFGDDSGLGQFTIRHANWFIKSKSLGKVTVGQGSQATDGIAEIDLSGATVVAGSAVETWNEGYFLRDENGFSPSTLTRTTLSDIAGILNTGGAGSFATFSLYADLFVGNMDGGRGNFVLYQSPTLAGFTFSAAWGEDDDWDVALRYAGTWGQFSVAAGIGYREGVTTDTEALVALNPEAEIQQKVVVGSASMRHEPTGLFVSLAGGRTDYEEFKLSDPNALRANFTGFDLLDAKYFYVKAGIYQKFIPLGKTSIYGEYYRAWDIGSSPSTSPSINTGQPDSVFNEESEVFGVGIVQHIDAAAMEIYAAYRHYKADDVTDFWSGQDSDIRMDAVMTGGRIKF